MSELARNSYVYQEKQVILYRNIQDSSSACQWNRYLTLYVAFFTIIGGLRWNVGADSLAYAWMFEYGLVSEESTEPVLQLMIKLVDILGLHASFGLGMMTFCQIFPITKSLQANKQILIYLPFVMFGGRYWDDMMCVSRQMMAVSLFMWGIKFIIKRKLLAYCITVGVCYCMHNSAIVLLPLYFIKTTPKLVEKRVILILLIIICFLIGQSNIVRSISSTIIELTSFIGYDRYVAVLEDVVFSEDGSHEQLVFGPMMLTYLLIPLFIVWFGPKLREYFGSKVKAFDFLFLCSVIYGSLYLLICNVSHILIRPIQYLEFTQMYMGAMTLMYLVKHYRTEIKQQISCLAFIVVISLNLFWSLAKTPAFDYSIKEQKSYKTFFFHDYDQYLPR